MSEFQYHTGSIQTYQCIIFCLFAVIVFQYHTGSIQTLTGKNYKKIMKDFNTTLVLFKQLWTTKKRTKRNLFQYHTGSIQTCIWIPIQKVYLNFNTTLVLFKLRPSNCFFILETYFNTTLVLFKRLCNNHICRIYRAFQYHTGSIQTQKYAKIESVNMQFQYHTGSIQTMNNVSKNTILDFLFQYHTGSIQTKKEII